MKAKPLDLTKTAAALERYDAADAAIENVDASDWFACKQVLKAAEDARADLAHAYADDTADRNQRVDVLAILMAPVGLAFVRRMVADFLAERRAA